MKRILLLLLPLLLFLLLPQAVQAKETSERLTETENEVREGLLALLPDPAKERLPDPTDEARVSDALGFRALCALLAETLTDTKTEGSKTLLLLFTVTLFFVAASLFIHGEAVKRAVESAAALSYFLLLFEAIERALGFFGDLSALALGLSPLYVTLFASGGATASAAAAGAGFSAFLALLELFSATLLPPLLRLLLSLALLCALGNSTLIRELSARISGVVTLLFSIFSLLLLASLSFQSILASSADSVALRTVKYTASSVIPHVGGTLSGALGALQASLSLLRGALGGTAVIALLVLLLPPLVELLLLRLILSLSASVTAFTESAALSDVIARFRRVLDFLLAALLLSSLLFLLLIGIFAALSAGG